MTDAGGGGGVGGTQATLARWQRNIGAADIIDLRALREREASGRPVPETGDARVATHCVRGPEAATPGESRQRLPTTRGDRRTLKSMLFADFAGYSRLHDARAPLFQRQFLEIGAAAIAASTANSTRKPSSTSPSPI